jgi:hypothetical protein
MDPESLKNVPSYLVLAYAIVWDLEMDGSVDAASGVDLPSYVLLDLRAYQRPDVLGVDGLNDIVCNLLSEMYDFCITGLKIKVIEA